MWSDSMSQLSFMSSRWASAIASGNANDTLRLRDVLARLAIRAFRRYGRRRPDYLWALKRCKLDVDRAKF